MKDVILRADGLKVSFRTERGLSWAVRDVSFELERGKVLGIVGESGSGKSMTALAVMRLIPSPHGRIAGGSVLFEGEDLLKKSEKDIRSIRGNKIAMIFQEPMTSLNPVFRIGFQLSEALELHRGIRGEESRRRCEEMLAKVRIPDPERVMKLYPHELSGGMRQRVMIAMAILCEPRLMIADEPTTALDVTIQAQILRLLAELKDERKMSMIFITHDLGVIAEIADRVAVMYAGQLVEEGDVEDVLRRPLHPYTEGLIGAIPENYDEERGFLTIPGSRPGLHELSAGCAFAPRCAFASEACREKNADFTEAAPSHRVRCMLYSEGGKRHG